MKNFFLVLFLKRIYLVAASLLTKLIQNPKNILKLIPELFIFFSSAFEYKKNTEHQEKFKYHPILFQRNLKSSFDAHYVYQAYWATKKITKINPSVHKDISSNIPFVVQLAATIPVDYFEYNPPELLIENIRAGHCDLRKLPFDDSSVQSLSCLHVLEHIGLGRYGDKIDPNGMKSACLELIRCLADGGNLFVSFPVGRHSVEFNAHRVTNPHTALTYFPKMELKEFSCVDDEGQYFENVSPSVCEGMNYACGMFWLIKK